MTDKTKINRNLLVWFILAVGVVFLLLSLLLLYRGATFWNGFMMSLSGSTVVSAIMSFLGDRYGDNIKGVFEEGLDGIKEVLSNQSFVFKPRKELRGSYDGLYNGANSIKICGVLLEAVIDYVCKKDKGPNHWVRRLAERKNVEVKLIIPDPDSDYVALLDNRIRENGSMPLADKIRKHIAQLTDLTNRYSAAGGKLNGFPPLARGSSIKVFKTHKTINFSITHAINSKDSNDPGTLYFGLVLNKEYGPMYQVNDGAQAKLHGTILEYFNMLIDKQDPFFVWDERGIR
ncbi:MAG: hypothetical protein LBU98_01835 [Alistipes sp.]|jgi:hypothetical protein|nr:hypothetical protein [Alistipes sp.]